MASKDPPPGPPKFVCNFLKIYIYFLRVLVRFGRLLWLGQDRGQSTALGQGRRPSAAARTDFYQGSYIILRVQITHSQKNIFKGGG